METKKLLQPVKLLFLSFLVCMVACDKDNTHGYLNEGLSNNYGQPNVYENTEEYQTIVENPFMFAQKEPLSTFSIDVDVASYSNMRRFLNNGELPPADAIRTEELINYFSYQYQEPDGNTPVKITSEVGRCPWNSKHRLARLAIKAKNIPTENLPASNFVFLLDVSGSMYGSQKLGLVKSSLKLLVNNLREKDKVSIVVYAGAAGLILPPTSGENKQMILDALNELSAGGSTAGGEGIKLAYKTAKENFIKDGNNRIILCTDGDFNVGISSPDDLEKMIEQERKSGVYLTVLGYGMGNYKDNRMQVLAEKGNGNHAYIDNLQEANKVLVNEFGANMYTVAKDVKLQIEFNPNQTLAYRLIGYESRLLDHEDFDDDTKDAGDMGPGHAVTAFYEIVPVGSDSDIANSEEGRKYQKEKVSDADGLFTVYLRYKHPENESSEKIDLKVFDTNITSEAVSPDFSFASAVAMFSHLLRDSEYKGDATFEDVISLANKGTGYDEQGYRKEFIRLVEIAKGLKK